MPDVMADRRASPRYPLVLVVEITDLVLGDKSSARTSDVSKTGCYIDTLSPLPHGSQVHIRLQRGNEDFETDGQVVYVSPGLGMGIRFNEGIPVGVLAILDRWIGEHLKRGVR
jgi:hypothetical protein